MKVFYNSNNSGGRWWLTDKDWLALEAAGWVVEWLDQMESPNAKLAYVGTKAVLAYREGLKFSEAVKEFELITGQDYETKGCECCSKPHDLYIDDSIQL